MLRVLRQFFGRWKLAKCRLFGSALNATGEVRARLVDDTIIEVGRKLSRGWQNMGRVELGTDGDEDGNEWITIEELPTLRRSWVESQVSTVIDRHNG